YTTLFRSDSCSRLARFQSKRQRKLSLDRRTVADATPEDRMAVVGKRRDEGAAAAAARPPADIVKDSVDGERLVRAVGADVRDPHLSSDERARDERREPVVRRRQGETAAGDRRGRGA